MGVAVSGATLTLSALANGGKDHIDSFQPPQTDYQSLLNDVSSAQQAVVNASASFGATQSWIESQQTYINGLVSTLQNGVSNLIDANMSAESAQLTALQTQQQLGTQVLAIANQQPASILALFK
jgi:flagellin